MHLPQIMMETEGVKEKGIEDMARAIRLAKEAHSIEGVYTGALASVYQKSRVERVLSELGLETVSPLWHIDQLTHLSNLTKEGFKVIMTGAAALGLDGSGSAGPWTTK